MSNQEMVAEFHKAAQQDHDGWQAWARLRAKLLRDECEEVCEILDTVADGIVPTSAMLRDLMKELADVSYVTYGAAVPIGDLDTALRLVHQSNMTKFRINGAFDRRDDGAVFKGGHYRPPDMTTAVYIRYPLVKVN